jgi:UDP-N-acetylmuramoylalanine--D-glutamate ligase
MAGEFKGQRVTLLGLGTRTHVSLARFLVQAGAVVTITDRKNEDQLQQEIGLLGDLPVRLALGDHPDSVLQADLICVTPGASREQPLLQQATQRGIPISSEIEILFRFCPAPILGITGSSGKTTTTTLTGLMLENQGRRVWVGGNIGIPLVDKLEQMTPEDRVVLELSSFQLEHMKQSPHIGAILNVTPNHLDRHGTMERYAEAKFNLLRYQSAVDFAVLGVDDPIAASLVSRCPGQVAGFRMNGAVERGAFLDNDTLRLSWNHITNVDICKTDEIGLRGRHNLYNVLAAATLATAAGANLAAIRRVATTFAGVEHRLEPVRDIGGVRYYNDSIATAPERTLAALRSFAEPIVLIAGGMSKHLPLEEMVAEIRRRVVHLLLMGELGDEILQAMGHDLANPSISRASGLEDAVELAQRLARPGDVVVMSPGGTSFDRFRDFEERGRRFKELVTALRNV